jgi:hypothetical protein
MEQRCGEMRVCFAVLELWSRAPNLEDGSHIRILRRSQGFLLDIDRVRPNFPVRLSIVGEHSDN